jgi:hypothetical protein
MVRKLRLITQARLPFRPSPTPDKEEHSVRYEVSAEIDSPLELVITGCILSVSCYRCHHGWMAAARVAGRRS